METAVQILVLVVAAAIVVFSMHVGRDRLHPAALHAGTWLVVCSIYLFTPHSMRQLSIQSLLCVLLAVISFCSSSLLTSRQTPVVAHAPQAEFALTRWRELLFILPLLGMPLFLLKAQALAQSTPYTESDFINLRIALTGVREETQTYGVLGYLIPIAFASVFVELAASKGRRLNWRGWVGLLLSCIYAVLSTGRTYLFLLVTTTAFIMLLQRRARLGQVALLALSLFSAAFFGLGMLANKIGADTPNPDALEAFDALALYLLGGVAAFDVWLEMPSRLEWGLNALRTPLAVAQALGADVTVLPLVKEYVYIPLPTNVYTALQPYYADFSWPGLLAFFAMFGSLHGWLYKRARQPGADPRTVIFASLAMYPLLLQFFQDQYLSLLSTWVTFCLLVLPAFRRDCSHLKPSPDSAATKLGQAPVIVARSE
jgi:oligosaccharide repeat unit polymerase